MSLTEGFHILDPSSPQLERILSGIVYLHGDCIINDNTMAAFLPPLSYDRMLQRWRGLIDQITTNQRFIIVCISQVKDRVPGTEDRKPPFPTGTTDYEGLQEDGLEVSGLISLYMPESETGCFRGEAQSFVVSGYHRRRGIGRKLIEELEIQAVKHGRWNVMLEATVGTPAETIYARLAWTRLGVVKDYGYRPTGKGEEVELVDGVYFWKDLRDKK